MELTSSQTKRRDHEAAVVNSHMNGSIPFLGEQYTNDRNNTPSPITITADTIIQQ